MFVRRWAHFQGYYETTNICCCQNFTIISSLESLCIFLLFGIAKTHQGPYTFRYTILLL